MQELGFGLEAAGFNVAVNDLRVQSLQFDRCRIFFSVRAEQVNVNVAMNGFGVVRLCSFRFRRVQCSQASGSFCSAFVTVGLAIPNTS